MKNFFDLQRFVEEYTNTKPNQTLKGTTGDDYFDNSGSIVKIYGYGGNDTVKNTGNVVTISAGAGNNSISSFGGDVSITTGAGADYVENYTSGSTTTKNVKMLVGDGDNTVFSSGESSNVTIVSGSGADSVKSYSNNAKISVGAGNDYVHNGSYSNTSQKRGSNSLFVLGAGDDSIENAYSDNVTISGGIGNDLIITENSASVSVSGGDGNDTITNSLTDYYYSSSKPYNVTISGDAGNDYIRNDYNHYRGGDYASLSGGKGKDTIADNSKYSTITGGADADLVSLGQESSSEYTTIQYTYGDGDDTIIGFNSDDTLQITTNEKFTTMTGGNDLYLMFDNDQVITLKDVDLGVGGVGRDRKSVV